MLLFNLVLVGLVACLAALFCCLVGWLYVGWLTGSFASLVRLFVWLVGLLGFGWLGLVGWLLGCCVLLVVWFVCFVCWFVLFGWLVCLVGCLFGWLVGLVGCCVCLF